VLLRRVASLMVGLVPEGTTRLGGLELGGVPLATMLSQLTGLPALFIRKQAKDYGTCRLAEGGDPGARPCCSSRTSSPPAARWPRPPARCAPSARP
jgi:orotate phosphoribosyltransferase